MTSPAFRENYALIDWSIPLPARQRKLRPPVQRSHLSSPMLVRSFSEPLQSMADGKYYDNPRDLERSYRADGNPQGQEYTCLGNENPTFTEHVPDAASRRNDLRQAMHDVVTGNLPPEIAAIV